MATPPKLPAGFKGPWKRAPKLNAGIWQVGKVGKGPLRGQFVAKRMPGATKPKPDPYAGHPDAPLLRQFEGQDWAQNIIRQMRREQTHHEQWVGNTVMPWQSGALTGLANINKAAQDQFTGQQQAAAQGMAQAGGATPGMVQGVSGGAVAGPNAFQRAATAQAMATQASTMGQVAQWQGLMGTLGPTTFSQGQVAALSDYAKGLPVLYAQKRQERVDAMNQYIAEQQLEQQKLALELAQFEETQRRNRVDESIRATNAQSNAAIAFANLGIDAAQEARLGMPDTVAPPPTDLPPGYTVVPNSEGGWDIREDPSYVAPGSDPAPGEPGGTLKPPYKNWVGGWTRQPSVEQRKTWRKQGRNFVQVDGRWWVAPKPKPPSSGPGSRRPKSDLESNLRELYHGDQGGPFSSASDGWATRHRGNPNKVVEEVARWVRENKPSFIAGNSGGRRVNTALLESVLRDAIGGPDNRTSITNRVLDVLTRGYMKLENGRWVWK